MIWLVHLWLLECLEGWELWTYSVHYTGCINSLSLVLKIQRIPSESVVLIPNWRPMTQGSYVKKKLYSDDSNGIKAKSQDISLRTIGKDRTAFLFMAYWNSIIYTYIHTCMYIYICIYIYIPYPFLSYYIPRHMQNCGHWVVPWLIWVWKYNF